MPVIENAIPAQGFEIVRDRVAAILADEIDRQSVLSYEPYLALVEVETERSIPLDKTETDTGVIVVSFAADNFSNKDHSGSEDGLITIHVDCYTSAKAKDEGNGIQSRGDKIAMLRCQKLLGLCRYILSDPIYKTLGLAVPKILRVYSGEINIKPVGPEDADNQAMGRYTLYVSCNESNRLIVPSLIAGYTTSVQLDNTSQGYFYEG
jgi:hypothetical protein